MLERKEEVASHHPEAFPQTKSLMKILTGEGGHHSPAITPKSLHRSVAGMGVQVSKVSKVSEKKNIVLEDAH